MVNAVSMDNVEHAYAVQQLRKSGKNAKIVSLLDIFTKSQCLKAWVKDCSSITTQCLLLLDKKVFSSP